ncbi:MAG: hypothetical protein K2K97_09450 [Muribaculaceae bacterium]|nr:hypothetical protein [Muribaculaceae bacterium]
MENIQEILRLVIPSDLLAESLGELACMLGYKGRSTLYRIINGNASNRAIASVCHKLKDTLFIDEDSLKCMYATIVNTNQLVKIVKPFMLPKGEYSVGDIIDSFLLMDFSLFPDDFKSSFLDGLLNLEHEDPEAYYTMLAYFYYINSDVDYYIKGKTHLNRCDRAIKLLGERYLNKFPENELVASIVDSYSKSELFNGEPPILWSLIRTISTLLQMASRPIETMENNIRFRAILNNREYWEGEDKSCLILTVAVPAFNANMKHYDVFRIVRENNSISYIGTIFFLSEEILSFSQKSSMLGIYEFDGNEIRLIWENPNDDPTTMGNKWQLLKKSHSQSLRMIDRSISEELLYNEKLKGQGWSEKIGYKVMDVIISRENLIINLLNGKSFSIPIYKAPFLRKIRPDFIIMIYERKADNMTFVCWPQIMHSLPLSLFKEM